MALSFRWMHPTQQQGRRLPSSSSSAVRLIRRLRVWAVLAFSTQQMNSLRASGVISPQSADTVLFDINTFSRSFGS